MSKLQSRESDCSVTALQNALRVHGRRLGYAYLRQRLGEVGDGADQDDLKWAIAAVGHVWDEHEGNRRNDAARWLWQMAGVGAVLLCVDSFGHWVTVAGPVVVGAQKRLCLMDPSRDPHNAAEGGVHWPRLSTIVRRWRAARRVYDDDGELIEGGRYYGIAVLPQET